MNIQEESKIEYRSRISRVTNYIDVHLGQPLELENIAEIASSSPFHFHRIFTFLIGETPINYIRRLQIEKTACRLRENMDISISKIAGSRGFCTISLFSRVFGEFSGLTPSQLHKMKRPVCAQDGILFNKDGRMVSKSLTPEHVLSPQLYSVRFKISYFVETKVEVKEMPDMRTVYCRHIGAFKEIVKAYEKLIKWTEPRGLYIPNVTKSATVTHDDPLVTESSKVHRSVCITVEGNVKGKGEISSLVIPGGKYAVGHFELGTEDFGKAWNTMCKWFMESGYQQGDGYTYELCHNSHRAHLKSKHIADICIPIKPLQRIICPTG